MKRRNTVDTRRVILDLEMTSVGGDFIDKRMYDRRGYVPSPSIESFHLEDKNYIFRLMKKNRKKKSKR
jgi:hypothetical protein